MCPQCSHPLHRLVLLVTGLIGIALIGLLLSGCGSAPGTPTSVPTPRPQTPTPTTAATPTPEDWLPFSTYAYGELLPGMQVPIERSTAGEGGWYVIIGTDEGWAQFLSQMGQPAEIWQAVEWESEILIGALLGLREGRQHRITITDLDVSGIDVSAAIVVATPEPEQASAPWITYPFHFIRIPRIELPLGPVTFRFVGQQGQELGSQVADASEVTIAWLAGEKAAYPTPTPILATSTPEPTPTSTPVPNLQIMGIVLDVLPGSSSLRIVPESGDWQVITLMEGSSILLSDGQPTLLSQIEPGMTIRVLGYAGEENIIRAAHINVLAPQTQQAGFGSYQPRYVAVSTIYGGYDLPLAVADITAPAPITQTFSLSQTRVLTGSGFVVTPSRYKSFASLYNDPLYGEYPLFISVDSILHVTQLLFDRVYRDIEQTHLLPELTLLDREMFELSWAQYQAAQELGAGQGEEIRTAAQQNAAYFAVALSLLDPGFTPPEAIAPAVQTELSLISATHGITICPLFDSPLLTDTEKLQIDYAQFDPSRHGISNAARIRYSQAIAWHRAVTWRIEQRQELLNVVLLAHALHTNAASRILWQRVYDVLSFFDGQQIAPTLADYGLLAVQVWGQDPDLALFNDETKRDEFVRAADLLPTPDNRIRVLMSQSGTQPNELGASLLGQYCQIDRQILERTIGGDPTTGLETRSPSAIYLAAVLGSPEAYSVASQMGYDAYTEYFDQVRIEFDSLQDEEWTTKLLWNELYAYRLLIEDKNLSYPKWMRTRAWRRRELQAMLGHWTDVRTTAPRTMEQMLPANQTAAPAPWGYIEPQPQVYGHLAATLQMIVDELNRRLMLSSTQKDILAEWRTWLVLVQDVARRELTGQTLTDLEYQRLTDYGAVVARLTAAALDDMAQDDPETPIDHHIAAITSIADSQDAQLVEATGWVDAIYVVVERGQRQFLARGGVYSHYEFEWPLDTLLTNELWDQMLTDEQAPPRPMWVVEFVMP